jgi:hypothetical protein
MLHAADSIWGSPPHLEGSSLDSDPGAAPPENLGIHHDIEYQPRLAEEEVSQWSLRAGPQPSRLVVASDQVIPAQCGGVVMARLESPLKVENGLVESNPEAHPPEGLFIAKTLVRDQQEVPVKVLNATCCDQKVTKGCLVAHCEPVTLVTLPDVEQPHVCDTTPKL